MMNDEMSKYEAEVNRMRERYGEGAETPLTPRVNAVIAQPVQERIADLSKRLTEAGHMLAEARSRFAEARARKDKSEKMFLQIADDIMRAINEHREGTAEGGVYPPSGPGQQWPPDVRP